MKMSMDLLSPPSLAQRIGLDWILGDILKQAITGALPSQEGFDEIWWSIKDHVAEVHESSPEGTFRLREFG